MAELYYAPPPPEGWRDCRSIWVQRNGSITRGFDSPLTSTSHTCVLRP